MATAQGPAARPLPREYPDSPSWQKFEINEPGLYALEHDEIQRNLWGAGHTGPNGGFMIDIFCGSVDLDFNSHTLGADYGVAGVYLSPKQNVLFAQNYPKSYGAASLDSRFVVLRNGTIDLARGERTSTGIQFSNEWLDPKSQTGTRGTSACGPYIACPGTNIAYQRNDYRFESMNVLSNKIALVAEGSHTVIRDCVIESAGNAAIFIAGPNVTIENCEIRLRRLVNSFNSGGPTRAAIVLHDGTNAVIRNNRIRMDYGGLPSDTHCILVHDGATNVVIENNTFINVEGDPVTLSDGASVTMTNNKSERRWLPL